MAYTKPLVTTAVTIHDGSSITFVDTLTNGVIARNGSTARDQILHEETVDAVANDSNHYVLPYHSIIIAAVSVDDSASITEPDDAFCQEV